VVNPAPSPAYNPAVTYFLNDAVIYNGVRYVSTSASNLGNQPDASAFVWRAQVFTDPVVVPHQAPAPPAQPIIPTLAGLDTRLTHLETLIRTYYEGYASAGSQLAAIHAATFPSAPKP
jgi:hypothetical protein